jgi:hypothetical protein
LNHEMPLELCSHKYTACEDRGSCRH